MRHLTIRDIPEELVDALHCEKQRRGTSLNQVVIDILRHSLGVGGTTRSNGLAKLAGGWTEDEGKAFDLAVEESCGRL